MSKRERESEKKKVLIKNFQLNTNKQKLTCSLNGCKSKPSGSLLFCRIDDVSGILFSVHRITSEPLFSYRVRAFAFTFRSDSKLNPSTPIA